MATRFPFSSPSMRRVPTQQRSRATFDAIVEAAAHVLAARGWAKFTTNEVALVAGASIGSLYQYFPDKLALVESVHMRHLGAVLAALPIPGMSEVATPLATRVARVIDGIVDVHATNQRLHRVMLEEVPLAKHAIDRDFEAEYLRRYQALVLPDPHRAPNPADIIAARAIASAVEGTVHTAASRGELDTPEVRRELKGMVGAFLRERRAQNARPRSDSTLD